MSRKRPENPLRSSLKLSRSLKLQKSKTREDKGVRELIPHIGPVPIVIPLKLLLEDIDFPADNVSSRVTWKIREEEKSKNLLRVLMNAK